MSLDQCRVSMAALVDGEGPGGNRVEAGTAALARAASWRECASRGSPYADPSPARSRPPGQLHPLPGPMPRRTRPCWGVPDFAGDQALPTRVRIVIVGGGVIGASVAHHVALAGERDVLLLERDRSPAGTTWHAAGLMTCFGSTSETSTSIQPL